ncbi:MAG: DUF1579 family protein [Acidobacteriota bacterium]
MSRLAKLLLTPLTTIVLAAMPLLAETPPAPAEKVDMAEMMKRAERFTKPGPEHKLLERFLGEWETEMKVMAPGAPPAGEKGVATGRWLIEGRWVAIEGKGTMMGMPSKFFYLIGYDNFKMSYVTAGVSSIDTAMAHSEGDVDPATGALLSYGTIDEYLTGENDKMVKYVWRFPDPTTLEFEVHDLPIGESNTEVVHFTYHRKK